MADISNKALSLLLLIAIVVSISGTVLTFNRMESGITGRVTDSATGETNFTIDTALSIRFNNNLIPFGTGTVNDSVGSCVMGSNHSPPNLAGSGCIGFNTTVNATNLTIENDGNVPANVSINFTKNASTFIGGTSPSFMYRVRNAEASSCTLANATSMREVGGAGNETDVNTTMTRVCTNLLAADTSDLFDIAVWIRVPEDAATGDHTVTITALACDDASC